MAVTATLSLSAQVTNTNAPAGPTGYFRSPVYRDNMSLSMGGSGVSVLDNLLAMFGDNPASLSQKDKSYDLYLSGLVGANTGLGIGVADSHTSDLSAALTLQVLASQGASNFVDSNSTLRASFSLGYTAASVLSFALRSTYHYGPLLFGTTNHFFTFTPGLLFSFPNLSIGFCASDIFPIGEVNYPSYYSLGISGTLKRLLLSFQGDYLLGRALFPDSGFSFHLGARYAFEKFIALSAGYAFDVSTYRQTTDGHTLSFGVEFFTDKHRLYLSDAVNLTRVENTLQFGYRFVPASGKAKEEDPYGNP